MKTKILFVTILLVCFKLNAQDMHLQQSPSKENEERLSKQFMDVNRFPGADVWYDTMQRRLIIPDRNTLQNPLSTNTENTLTNTFHLTKDINTITNATPANFNSTEQYAVLNNVIYYSANDGVHGGELWKSDGTAAGTKMVKDIYAGETGYVSNIISFNGKLYFFAQSADYGIELWVSDGTAAGTKILKDMVAGAGSSYPLIILNVNGTLFFLTEVGSNFQLWKTDGTAAGTVLITDLTTEKGISQIWQIVAVNNILFFTAQSTNFDNRELWRSDGTAPGTFMVKDINPNTSGDGPSHLTAYNNKLYFCANDGANQYLWVSDGTTAGTTYAPGFNNVTINTVNSVYPLPFIVAGGVMYFPAYNSAHGSELFKYNANDGVGVVLVKDINAVGNSTNFTTDVMAAIGNIVYFAFTDINGLAQLWKTNGSDAGTKKVADLPGATAYLGFFTGNGMLYFNASTATTGYEVWRSDGTAANTGLLKDIYPGDAASYPFNYTACNNKIFFAAKNKNGWELWQTDGTPANTAMIKDVNKTTTEGSDPATRITFKNSVIFNANTPDKGTELYISDGTAGGTHIIKDIFPGATGSAATLFKVKDNFAYFVANDASGSTAIFKTNGNINNALKSVNWPANAYLYDYAIADNGMVFYTLYNNNTYSYELWRTDGAVSETLLLVSNISYSSGTLTAMGNNAYFGASDMGSSVGTELWKSDGTVAGTKMMKDIVTGATGSYPHSLYAFNNTLYFGIYNVSGEELWKTNGIAGGTKKIKAVRSISGFQPSGSILYFSGSDDGSGRELWKTDGSAGGTKVVKDILAGSVSSNPSNFTDVDGTLFFTADNGTYQYGLWKTKGTNATTKFVKSLDINGDGSTYFSNFTSAASRLFFQLSDYLSPTAVWISDGTPKGTAAVSDSGLNTLGNISELKGSGNQLFLSGYNKLSGYELYVGDASLISSLQKTDDVAKALPVNNFSAQLLANPFSNQLNLNISSAEKQKVKLVISNASGNIYYNNIIDIPAGNTNHKINTASWPNSMYVISIGDITDKSNMVTLKAVK